MVELLEEGSGAVVCQIGGYVVFCCGYMFVCWCIVGFCLRVDVFLLLSWFVYHLCLWVCELFVIFGFDCAVAIQFFFVELWANDRMGCVGSVVVFGGNDCWVGFVLVCFRVLAGCLAGFLCVCLCFL